MEFKSVYPVAVEVSGFSYGETVALSVMIENKIKQLEETVALFDDSTEMSLIGIWKKDIEELVEMNRKLGFVPKVEVVEEVEVEPDWATINTAIKTHLESKEA